MNEISQSSRKQDLSIRPLTKADFDLLFLWLNMSHLRRFYQQEPVSATQINQKYEPRLAVDHPCNCLIAELDGQPFGYTQWYLNASFPDYGLDTINEPAGVSLDYYIGSTEYLGRGLGSRMLDIVVQLITAELNATDRKFFVGHRRENKTAIQCSRRARFSHKKSYIEDGFQHVLLMRT